MRVLIACQPGYGHLHPLVPFVRALIEAGHDVLVATSTSMRPVVKAAGLPFAPAGMDWLLARERDAFPEMADLPFGEEHFRLQLTRVFRDVTARRMVPDLLDLCRDWRPDLILRDDQEHGSLVAAELLGIPHVVAGVLWLYPPRLLALVETALDALLTEHGLTGVPPLERAYRHGAFAAMPPEWAAPGEWVPPGVVLVRPEAVADGDPDNPPDWLASMPDYPLAHASLGTIVGHESGLNDALIDAFRDAPVNLVLSIGPGQQPSTDRPLPPNVRVIDSIPAAIAQRCDVAIVHAGYGSAMSAIVHGRPMVMLPVAADQPRNALRCADLGLGVALLPGHQSPDAIRDATLRVLQDPAFAARAQSLHASTLALPPAVATIPALETLATPNPE